MYLYLYYLIRAPNFNQVSPSNPVIRFTDPDYQNRLGQRRTQNAER